MSSRTHELMQRAGYRIYQRRAHGGVAWDFSSPSKGRMDSSIFKTEEEAWARAEETFDREIARAREIMLIVNSSEQYPLSAGQQIAPLHTASVDLCWRGGQLLAAKVYEPQNQWWRVYDWASAAAIALATVPRPSETIS